ncbi:MAG: hypothetical protein CVV44_07910 [Spirochaetae bacterium HGW-Spirochaetae-1]|jgi:hypothetical protein|nr:MAG: hypothetical protein CVV44_07910 [Spirochaetae bacterium HGW-Spirochaetae-1]
MGVIIKDIKKSNNEIIRIEVSEFKGHELINIRIWYPAIDNASGDMLYKPTQKGVTLNISDFNDLQDGIARLANYIRDKESGNKPEQFDESVINDETDEEAADTNVKPQD